MSAKRLGELILKGLADGAKEVHDGFMDIVNGQFCGCALGMAVYVLKQCVPHPSESRGFISYAANVLEIDVELALEIDRLHGMESDNAPTALTIANWLITGRL